MRPLVGGKVYFYEAGTTTPKDTYTDSTGLVANTNPVILNARGEADIWLGAGAYKMLVTDEDDVAQGGAVDGIEGFDALEARLEQYTDTLRSELADDTAPNEGATLIGYDGSTVKVELDKAVKNDTYPPATGGTDDAVVVSFDTANASLRYGGSDLTPQNDEKNYWRGLPSQNSWGNAGNIGLYSVAFNRNGASYGAYSVTFGHDCVAYGVTSLAGGAGSCAGDPDDIDPANFRGYCAFGWGKNVQALGEKSTAFGEESVANTRASVAAGYFCTTGSYSGSGLGAVAMGRSARALGEGAIALGQNVQSSNGGYTIGSGVNPGTALNNTRANAVALGTNTAYPSFVVMPGSGTGAINDVGYTEIFAHAQRYTDMLGGVTLFTCGTAAPVISNPSGGGYGGIEWAATIAGVLTSVCRVDSDTNIPSLVPTADNSRRLGSASLRWSVIYAGTGTINTSDAGLKQDIRNLTAAEKATATAIKGLVKVYRFKDAVAAKGSAARLHVGVIAQQVRDAFAANGLDGFAYGVLCKDRMPDGTDRLGIRYEELSMFILAAL